MGSQDVGVMSMRDQDHPLPASPPPRSWARGSGMGKAGKSGPEDGRRDRGRVAAVPGPPPAGRSHRHGVQAASEARTQETSRSRPAGSPTRRGVWKAPRSSSRARHSRSEPATRKCCLSCADTPNLRPAGGAWFGAPHTPSLPRQSTHLQPQPPPLRPCLLFFLFWTQKPKVVAAPAADHRPETGGRCRDRVGLVQVSPRHVSRRGSRGGAVTGGSPSARLQRAKMCPRERRAPHGGLGGDVSIHRAPIRARH